MKVTIFLLLILSFFTHADGALPLPTKPTEKTPLVKSELIGKNVNSDIASAGNLNNFKKLEAQIDILNAQNQMIDKYIDRLTAGYYWSLSFAGGFLLLFLGFNIYNVKGQIKDEKNNIKFQLEAEIAKNFNALEQRSLEQSNILNTKIQESKDSCENFIKSQIKSEVDYFSIVVEKTKTDLVKAISESEEKSKKEFNATMSKLKGNLGSIESDLSKQTYSYYDLKVKFEKLDKTASATRIRTLIDFIDFVTKKDRFTFVISYCLDDLLNLLEDGGKAHKTDIALVTKTLDSLLGEHEILVNKIKAKL
ncbi:hypothetical protein K2227_11120 [Shewanella putrefaciens]|nr:hypothetical protein K2227_11120 [Shewanella putrefaciens]